MKICFYSPYIPKHVGGGEKYLLDCARLLMTEHQVTVAVPNGTFDTISAREITQQYEAFLGSSLKNITWTESPLGSNSSIFAKWHWTRQFDICYYLTDGSFFWSGARHNIAHIQFPFTHPLSLLNQLKLKSWSVVNTNSNFTKQIIEQHWPIQVDYVHQPMVEPPQHKPVGKEKVILHVGRFFRQLHCKRQDMLVTTFLKMLEKEPKKLKEWQLVLIGSIEDQSYADEVAQLAQEHPQITIIHDATYQQLWDWYQRARIYWHATGYGVDEMIHPEKVEHFGISTVEAMSQQAVPIVINKGGQPEVVGPDLDQLLWDSDQDLAHTTLQLIDNPKELLNLGKIAQQRAGNFNKQNFSQTLQTMIQL